MLNLVIGEAYRFFHYSVMSWKDNTIAYWRKFVAEYYSPRAKKRWCLSLYDNVGHHALGVFPQAAMVSSWELFTYSKQWDNDYVL